jgi:hypothetical protein
MISDADFLLDLLRTGPQTLQSVLAECYAAGRPGQTVHSRVSDLRRQGYDIRCERLPASRRGERARYRYALIEAPVQLRLGENAA